jgi:hypothetical protein
MTTVEFVFGFVWSGIVIGAVASRFAKRGVGTIVEKAYQRAVLYAGTEEYQRTLAEVAYLAIAADGEITELEWRTFGEVLLAQGINVRRDEVRQRFAHVESALRDREVLAAEVRKRAAMLGRDGAQMAMQLIRELARNGAAFSSENAMSYRRGIAKDSEALLRSFERWLDVADDRPAR